MAIRKVKELVASAYHELELLIWYQKLVSIAIEQEDPENCQLLIEAYKPLGDCYLIEIKDKLEKIQKELKVKTLKD